MSALEANQEMKDNGEGCLGWAVVGRGSSGDNKEVGEKTEWCKTYGKACDNSVDEVAVVGEGITEK